MKVELIRQEKWQRDEGVGYGVAAEGVGRKVVDAPLSTVNENGQGVRRNEKEKGTK